MFEYYEGNMIKYILFLLAIFIGVQQATAQEYNRTLSPKGARIYWEFPLDGSFVDADDPLTGAEVKLQFNSENIEIGPKEVKNKAHFHILINKPDYQSKIKKDGPKVQPPIFDVDDIHLGDGSFKYSLRLPPGTYYLQLVLGDHNHIAQYPVVQSERIKIQIK